MRKYIDAELYRNFNRTYYRNFVIFISLLAIALNGLWSISWMGVDFTAGFEIIGNLLFLGSLFIVFFVDMVTIEEYKNDTMKNVVSSGLSRDKIVLGKIITTIILAFIALIIILSSFYISGYILLPKISLLELKPIAMDAGIKILNAIPIWIASIIVFTFVALNIKSSIGAVTGYFMITNIIPNIFNLVFLILENDKMANFFRKISLSNALERVSVSTIGFRGEEVIIALIYIILFTVLSIMTFRKKDI